MQMLNLKRLTQAAITKIILAIGGRSTAGQSGGAGTVYETQAPARAVYDPFAVADERDHLHRFHHDHAERDFVI